MILEYLDKAMKKARYEILEDGTYYGEIDGLQGVYSNSSNLEDCRNILKEVLEEWILVRVSLNLEVPELDGSTVKIRRVA